MESPESVFARALNHLLAPNGWARERLAPFAGQRIAFRAPPLPDLHLRIADGGLVEPQRGDEASSLVIRFKPGFLLSLPAGIEDAMREVEVSGDPPLGAELLFLARHLRWDAEEDLARVFGDVAAHRMVGGAKEFIAAALDAGRRTAGALMEYAIDERRLLATRAEYDELASASAALRDAIERLDKRIERLG
jgi:ubiquinone biosynthesis protein UbiJ